MSEKVEIIVSGSDAGAAALLQQTGGTLGRLQASGVALGGAFSSITGSLTMPFTAAHKAMTGLLSLPNMVAAGIGGVLVRSVLAYSDAINDASGKSKVARETLQALSLQAANEESSFGEVTGAITYMLRNQQEAINGNEQMAAAFARVGISIDQLAGMGAEELWFAMADGMKGIGDQGVRTSVAMDILGRSGKGLVTMLSSGREGFAAWRDELGRRQMIMTDADHKAIDELNDAFATAGEQMKGSLGHALAGAAPQITASLEQIMAKVAALAESGVLQEWIVKAADGIGKLTNVAIAFGSWVAENGDWLTRVGLTLYGVKVISDTTAAVDTLVKTLKALSAVPPVPGAPGAPSLPGVPKAPGVPGVPGAPEGPKGFMGSGMSAAQAGGLMGLVATVGYQYGKWYGDVTGTTKAAGEIGGTLLARGRGAEMYEGAVTDLEVQAGLNRRRKRMGGDVNLHGPVTVIADNPQEFADALPRPTGAEQL